MTDESSSGFGIYLGTFRIPMLNDSYYYLWYRKVELVLRSKGLFSIVNGTEKKPTEDEAKIK